jgi:hypothetical protein
MDHAYQTFYGRETVHSACRKIILSENFEPLFIRVKRTLFLGFIWSQEPPDYNASVKPAKRAQRSR